MPTADLWWCRESIQVAKDTAGSRPRAQRPRSPLRRKVVPSQEQHYRLRHPGIQMRERAIDERVQLIERWICNDCGEIAGRDGGQKIACLDVGGDNNSLVPAHRVGQPTVAGRWLPDATCWQRRQYVRDQRASQASRRRPKIPPGACRLRPQRSVRTKITTTIGHGSVSGPVTCVAITLGFAKLLRPPIMTGAALSLANASSKSFAVDTIA